MQKLLDGYRQFRDQVFPTQRAHFKALSEGQKPEALFITCSDSRVVPSLITQLPAGELFEIQNAGNIVPTFGASGDGTEATIEYAVSFLHVRHVVVCGHSRCGAMGALLDPKSVVNYPSLIAWLRHAESTGRVVRDLNVADDGERLMRAVQENVRVQLAHLRTHPAVAAALARGELQLHGWVYRFEDGEVDALCPETGEFGPLQAAAATE